MSFPKKPRLIAALGLLAGVPCRALAQSDALERALDVGGAAGLSGAQQGETLAATIGFYISAALGLLGVILLVILIYAGFLWMTAGGDTDKVTKAKKLITNAVIGIIIVFSAYAITTFIVTRVTT